MGNLIPAVIGVPPVAFGLHVMRSTLVVFGTGLVWMGGGLVATWLAVNFLGLFANRKIRTELGMRLRGRLAGTLAGAHFVGCATPAFTGWLDPHEDIGFLFLDRDRLAFLGDSLELVVMKRDVCVVRFRPNVHTLVGLGRWISVEGVASGKPVRLLLEPREKPTLWGNLRYSNRLRAAIEDWLRQEEAQA